MYQRKDCISLVDAKKQLSILTHTSFQKREILKHCLDLNIKTAIAWTYPRPLRKLLANNHRSSPIKVEGNPVIFMLNEYVHKLLEDSVKAVPCCLFSLDGIQPNEVNYQELRVSSSRDIAIDQFLERDIKLPPLVVIGASEDESRIVQHQQRKMMLERAYSQSNEDNNIAVSFKDLLISFADFERLKSSLSVQSVSDPSQATVNVPHHIEPTVIQTPITNEVQAVVVGEMSDLANQDLAKVKKANDGKSLLLVKAYFQDGGLEPTDVNHFIRLCEAEPPQGYENFRRVKNKVEWGDIHSKQSVQTRYIKQAIDKYKKSASDQS